VAYAVRSLIAPDELREPVWAATHATEAARRAAIRMLGLQVGTPVEESVLASHPLALRELERQTRDLDILEKSGEASIPAIRSAANVETLLTAEELSQLDA